MKINYRNPTVLEEMDNAIANSINSDQRIESFELTGIEFRKHYTSFDKLALQGGATQYLYKSIPIKVQE
jgi:regulatory protein YycI of two-component signal transduction system YycFG